MSISVNNNDSFKNIENTILGNASIATALASLGLTNLPKVLVGYVTPTAAGNYAVVDKQGSTLVLPAGAVVTNVIQNARTTLVGGTSIQVGLALTSGTVVVNALSSAVVLAAINIGSHELTASTVGVNRYVSATVVGTFTAGTEAIRIVYL